MKVHQKQGFITCLKAVFSFQNVVNLALPEKRAVLKFYVLHLVSVPYVTKALKSVILLFHKLPSTFVEVKLCTNLICIIRLINCSFLSLSYSFCFCRVHFVSSMTLIPTSKACQSYICLLENLSTAW